MAKLGQGDLALVIFAVTYCALQIACSVMLLACLPGRRSFTDYVLLTSAVAGLCRALLPPLTRAPRGEAGRRAAAGEHRGDALSALMLAMVFVIAAACLISDASGSCALNGGRLPSERFGLPAASGEWPAMGPAPWNVCIAVDLGIAACLVNVLLFLGAAASSGVKWRRNARTWQPGGAAATPPQSAAAAPRQRAAAAPAAPVVGVPLAAPLPAAREVQLQALPQQQAGGAQPLQQGVVLGVVPKTPTPAAGEGDPEAPGAAGGGHAAGAVDDVCEGAGDAAAADGTVVVVVAASAAAGAGSSGQP